MHRLAAVTLLSASLALAGCQNPDGSTNWGNTALVGAGVGVAAALVAGAATDNPRPYYGNRGYRPSPRYGYGGGHGYGRPYRGW
ncbi:hypothetical protein [Belnapia rosea]|uniref:Lipoprotein n=1 Tax=Belnapia rosea TaxID=938405 RepID=A0A1G6WMQ5_9PROT|nr:hypothetical protein [Belnapia rosea]SDB68433.1 hypothetical protein SAMN02927895_03233 [Belnapia rosea]SDD67240.1 hypothetical protein SAMN04487779_10113 [Belnapia rosea]